MTHDEFWALIAEHVTHVEGDFPTVEGVEAALASRPVEEIVSFDLVFSELYCKSYSWDLWGAGYVINGGCSDDGFDYFRGWLIATGRDVFDAALRDPDSLADVTDDDVECEDMLYVAGHAYEQASGGKELTGASYKYPDLGDGWDFDDDDEMRRRYPKLCAKFLDRAD